MGFLVGTDVGGTFTDLWVAADFGDTRVTQDERGTHVVTRAGYILSTGDTAWRIAS